jgi:hypothetical protein
MVPTSTVEDSAWEAFAELLPETIGYLQDSHQTVLNSVRSKDRVRRLVHLYFRNARPELEAVGLGEDELRPLDLKMQELLRMLSAVTRRTAYLSIIGATIPHLSDLELQRELAIGRLARSGVTGYLTTGLESAIIRTLAEMIPSASLSYRQALEDLRDPRRVSFRGTADELRETVRELLDHLAPDSEVTSAPGFKLEDGTTKPTMRQKVRFILRARRVPSGAMEGPMDAIELVEARTASFARSTYTMTSVGSHVQSTREEVAGMKPYVDSILSELLQLHRERHSPQLAAVHGE